MTSYIAPTELRIEFYELTTNISPLRGSDSVRSWMFVVEVNKNAVAP